MRKLKSDLFGTVWRGGAGGGEFVLRDTGGARWWTAWLARSLCRREARALARLDGLPGTPRLLSADRRTLRREWIEGRPMQLAQPRNAEYFRAARAPARGAAPARHRAQRSREGAQLARHADRPRRRSSTSSSRSSRRAAAGCSARSAREDIRHLLKHKRSYCPEQLTARERRILATPSAVSRVVDGDRQARLHVRHAPPVRLGRPRGRRGPATLVSCPVAISNEHNLNSPPPAAKPFGIRVRLRARDPFTRLVGADWQKLHWFATERERDLAFADMAPRHPYSRRGDEPAVVFEKVAEGAAR